MLDLDQIHESRLVIVLEIGARMMGALSEEDIPWPTLGMIPAIHHVVPSSGWVAPFSEPISCQLVRLPPPRRRWRSSRFRIRRRRHRHRATTFCSFLLTKSTSLRSGLFRFLDANT